MYVRMCIRTHTHVMCVRTYAACPCSVVCVYACLQCMYVSRVGMRISACVYVCMHTHASMKVCMREYYVGLYVCMSNCLYACMSVCMSALCLRVSTSLCLYVCMHVCMSYVHMYVWMCVCLPSCRRTRHRPAAAWSSSGRRNCNGSMESTSARMKNFTVKRSLHGARVQY